MKKYTSKYLTNYAQKIGIRNAKVWYSRMDGWWIEVDLIEEYLGVWSAEAKTTIEKIALSDFTRAN